jgi:hypothetical protein
MPPELLTAYETAADLEQERRFDEALNRYWEALRLDPTNLTARLRLGQLHEKAGLFLAALTNYARVIAFGNPGGRNLPRGLYSRSARREWDRVLVLAKYRAIVLLGGGSIVGQWSKREIRYWRRLHEEFTMLLEPLAQIDRRDPAAYAIGQGIKALVEVKGLIDDRAESALRRELTLWAYAAAKELKLSLGRLELKPSARPLTRRTVALTQACIERRYALMAGANTLDDDDVKRLARHVWWAGGPVPLLGWWPSWLRRWQWHEHYNAGCVYAIPLTDEVAGNRAPNAPNVRGDLARRAVERLERAITTRDADFIATWRDWVTVDDPDLQGLRTRPEFTTLVSMYFPRVPLPGPRQRYPQDQYRLTESRYTCNLLVELARRMHDVWHARLPRYGYGLTDSHILSRWCDQEREIWKHVRPVADDSYDWRTRHRLLACANELLAGADVKPIVVEFGGYEDQPLLRANSRRHAGDVDKTAVAARSFNDTRLKELAWLLDDPTDRPPAARLRDLQRLSAAMPTYDTHLAASPPVPELAELCNDHAVIWQKLSEWMRAEGMTSAIRAREAFVRAMQNATDRWERNRGPM